MKTKMTLLDMVDKPHYKNIIKLTNIYQEKEKGLRQLHYRWALIEDHDGINQTSIIRKMNFFFNSPNLKISSLESMQKIGYIERNCIKGKYANNNLTNFLRKLVDEVGVLETHLDDKGVTRYTISKNFDLDITLLEIKEYIEAYDKVVDISTLFPIKKDVNPLSRMPAYTEGFHIPKNRNKAPYSPKVDSYLLGLNSDFFNKCSKEEIDDSKKYLMDVHKAVSFFGKLKYEKTGETEGVLLVSNCFIEDIFTFGRDFQLFGGKIEETKNKYIFRLNNKIVGELKKNQTSDK